MEQYNGWLVIDKDLHMSSAKVVHLVKKMLKAKKVGHSGTLDPLATGILPIAIGEATKLTQYAMDQEKEYIFTVDFGSATSTDDLEGEVIASSSFRPIKDQISDILPLFIGKIQQAPPIYSAIKVAGQRAYDLARSGNLSELPAREILIKEIELLSYEQDRSSFRVKCGKGTYVRSLARDIGLKLGTYGHVSFLRRTRTGKFSLENAFSLDKLENIVHNPETKEFLLSVNIVLDDIPVLEVTDLQVLDLRYGRFIMPEFEFCNNKLVQALDGNGKLIALGQSYDNCFKPTRIFNH